MTQVKSFLTTELIAWPLASEKELKAHKVYIAVYLTGLALGVGEFTVHFQQVRERRRN